MKASRKIVGVIVAALALMLVPVAVAQADPFTMEIDNAIMNLGELSGVRAIDSSLEPPDPPATLTGELTDGDVNVPKAGFVFPTKTAEVAAGINADIDMEVNQDITGTFETATGALELDVSLKATVKLVGLLAGTCVISPIDIVLSSGNAQPYLGEPFTDGIEGEGVVSARWTGLPPVTTVSGTACGLVASLIAGPGGIAMSHGLHDFKTCATAPSNALCAEPLVAPEKEPFFNSAPPSTTTETTATFTYAKAGSETQPVDGFECSLDGGAFEACGSGESGTKAYSGLAKGSHSFSVKAKNSAGSGPAATHNWTINEKIVEPEPKPALLGVLKAAPKNSNVKRGKKKTITVKVQNVGESSATGVKVCVVVPKKLVTVKKCINKGALAPGATATAKFKVTVKKKARKGKKVSLKFTATATGLKASRGTAAIKVR